MKIRHFIKNLINTFFERIEIGRKIYETQNDVKHLVKEIRNAQDKISSIEEMTRKEINRLNALHIQNTFNNTDTIDYNKPTILVCSHRFHLLRNLFPLLNKLHDGNFQIVIFFAKGDLNFDRGFFRIVSSPFKFLFFDNMETTVFWKGEEIDHIREHSDYIFWYYYILHTCNVKAILVDEWSHPPLIGFATHPHLIHQSPPIFAFKHNITDSITNHRDLFLQVLEIITCYFVWGERHKEIIPNNDKICAGGYVRLDELKHIQTTETSSVLIIDNTSKKNQNQSINAIVDDIAISTDFLIYIKAHPANGESYKTIQETYPGRIILMGNFEDYLPVLSKCSFSISYGSSIAAESWALGKPHIIIPQGNHIDDFFRPVYPLCVCTPPGIMATVKKQKENWKEMEKYIRHAFSHIFSSASFISERIESFILENDLKENKKTSLSRLSASPNAGKKN